MQHYLYFLFLMICACFVQFLGVHIPKYLRLGVFPHGNLSAKRFYILNLNARRIFSEIFMEAYWAPKLPKTRGLGVEVGLGVLHPSIQNGVIFQSSKKFFIWRCSWFPMIILTSKMKNSGHFTFWVPFFGFHDTAFREFHCPRTAIQKLNLDRCHMKKLHLKCVGLRASLVLLQW